MISGVPDWSVVNPLAAREAAFAASAVSFAAPSPHYSAYTNLGVLLCEAETRREEALSVCDRALEHFPNDALLHFNRAVALDELQLYDAAAAAYERCIELDPTHADAHFNFARLSEIRGDKQGLVRHLSAYRRLSG